MKEILLTSGLEGKENRQVCYLKDAQLTYHFSSFYDSYPHRNTLFHPFYTVHVGPSKILSPNDQKK